MRWLERYLIYPLFAVAFAGLWLTFTAVLMPWVVIVVLKEKWRAHRRGEKVNWHIFKEGL